MVAAVRMHPLRIQEVEGWGNARCYSCSQSTRLVAAKQPLFMGIVETEKQKLYVPPAPEVEAPAEVVPETSKGKGKGRGSISRKQSRGNRESIAKSPAPNSTGPSGTRRGTELSTKSPTKGTKP